MKKYIPILGAVLLACSANAQEADNDINVVIFAPKAEVTKSNAQLPQCDNTEMLEQVSTQIREYQEGNPSDSIVGRREQALIVKNLKNFKEISIADFDYKGNYVVGKELVMTKVNYHLENDDMRLCQNTGSDIYLLMYPEGKGARVQIINFVPSVGSGNDFSIYYENLSPKKEAKTDENVDNGEMSKASKEQIEK